VIAGVAGRAVPFATPPAGGENGCPPAQAGALVRNLLETGCGDSKTARETYNLIVT